MADVIPIFPHQRQPSRSAVRAQIKHVRGLRARVLGVGPPEGSAPVLTHFFYPPELMQAAGVFFKRAVGLKLIIDCPFSEARSQSEVKNLDQRMFAVGRGHRR